MVESKLFYTPIAYKINCYLNVQECHVLGRRRDSDKDDDDGKLPDQDKQQWEEEQKVCINL